MGQKKSKQISETTNNMLNKNITNILNKTTNKTSNSFNAGQSVRLIATNGSTVRCGGDLNLKNLSGPITVSLVNSISNKTATELKTLLKNNAQNVVEQNEKAMAEMGGLIGTNMTSEQKTKVATTISNIIETNVTNETLNEAVNAFSFTQDGEIALSDGSTLDVSGDCNVTNESAGIEFQAENIIGNVIKTVAESDAFTEVINETKQSQELEVKGLSDLVGSLGDAISGMISASTGPIIAFFVVGGLVAIAGLYLMFSSGGNPESLRAILNNPSKTSTEKAAASQKLGEMGMLAKMGAAKYFIIGFVVLLALTLLGLGIWQLIKFSKSKDPDEKRRKFKEEFSECETEIDPVLPILDEVEKLSKKLDEAVLSSEKEAIQGAINDILIENEDILTAYNDCMKEKYNIGVKIKTSSVEGYATIPLRVMDGRGYYMLRGYETTRPQFRSWW